MALKVQYKKHVLRFKFDAGTSRGILKDRITYFIKVCDTKQTDVYGIGEASPLKGLSVDYRPDFEENLDKICKTINGNEMPDKQDIVRFLQQYISEEFPAVFFGFEVALLDLFYGGMRQIYDTPFYEGKDAIPTNGLIWMGKKEFMQQQIEEKLTKGFRCIKMKIGAIDFDTECRLIHRIRQDYEVQKIILRVDANGAFSTQDAAKKLEVLAQFDLHSIEQPIAAGQWEEMRQLCQTTPIPIALDEELIGIHTYKEKEDLLQKISPQYLILKPTLLGGLHASEEWIQLANKYDIDWWITSALEANIGLNAISQFVSYFKPARHQGLGTGALYHNNIQSPLELRGEWLYYNAAESWASIF